MRLSVAAEESVEAAWMNGFSVTSATIYEAYHQRPSAPAGWAILVFTVAPFYLPTKSYIFFNIAHY